MIKTFNMHCVTLLLVTSCVGYLRAEKPVAHLNPEKTGEIFQGVMTCLGETGLDPALLAQLRGGETPEDKDQKLPMFIHCAFLKTGYGKKNGHIKINKTLELYPKDVNRDALKKAMEECDKDEKNPVETSYKFFKCYREKTPVKLVL